MNILSKVISTIFVVFLVAMLVSGVSAFTFTTDNSLVTAGNPITVTISGDSNEYYYVGISGDKALTFRSNGLVTNPKTTYKDGYFTSIAMIQVDASGKRTIQFDTYKTNDQQPQLYTIGAVPVWGSTKSDLKPLFVMVY